MRLRLSERDRRFFAQARHAAFANPFSTERADLDAQLADTPADDPKVLERMSARVAARIESVAPRGEVRLAEYSEEDRELLFAALMFDAFHRFLSDIDEHLAREERAMGEPTRVSYAKPLISELVQRGLSRAEAVRMLELFYQLRRAHLAIALRLVGSGPSMRKLREDLWNSVFTRDIQRYERYLWNRMEDFSTLIVGETGTGKGEAALAMGRSGFIPFDERKEVFSSHFHDLLVPMHLSEFPETLLESELFGHKKGAFTGAIEQHEGVLARVKPHGVVFLDEIGEVSTSVQVKLLRVLQERSFTPVGSHDARRFSGRVVAATHRSIAELRRDGRMREDFFYRLCTHTIEVPSLRVRLAESRDELGLLVSHLCTRIVGASSPELAHDVARRIGRDLGADYPFPGNVRELEQCVRRVLLTGECARDPRGVASDGQFDVASLSQLRISAQQLVAQYCAALYAQTKSYVDVARITGLDRRTVKKHIDDLHGEPAAES